MLPMRKPLMIVSSSVIAGSGGGGGGGVPAPRFNSGWNNNYFDFFGGAQNELDIIGGSEIQDSASTVIPDSFRTAHGHVTGSPTGVVTYFFQVPEDETVLRELTWTDRNGAGTYPSVFQIINGNSLDVSDIGSNKIRFKHDNNQASGLGGVLLRLNHAGGGKWADNFHLLPVGQGNALSPNFASKTTSITFGPDHQFMRSVHWTGVEFGNPPGVGAPAGPNYRFPLLFFPQDGDTKLSKPLNTAANRNQNEADLYFQDGMKFERIVRIATNKNVSIWHNAATFADGNNTNGTNYTSTYHQTIAGLAAAFSLATDKYFAVEYSNEPWNPGYVVFHLMRNEACNWGRVRPDALPQVKLVYDTNIALTGTPAAQDGTVPSNGDRVLVAGQTNPVQNGPYVVNSGGAWSRAADAITSYCFWYCNSGRYPQDQDIDAVTTATAPFGWKNTTWFCRNTGAISVGTTPLTITQFLGQERTVQKSLEIFAYYETAFNALGVGPANGAANRLVRTITAQNQGAISFATLLNFPDGAGGTAANHIEMCATNIYPDVVNNSLADNVNYFADTYNGAVAPVIAATKNAIDAELTRAQTHYNVVVGQYNKLFAFYECGYNNIFLNHTFRAALWQDNGQADNQLYKCQRIDLMFPGMYVNWFALNSPIDKTTDGVRNSSTAWGLCELTGDPANGAYAKRLKAVNDYKNGVRVLTDALGTPDYIARNDSAGKIVLSAIPSAYGVTWSLATDQTGLLSVNSSTGVVTTSDPSAATLGLAKTFTLRQTLGPYTKDTVFSTNVIVFAPKDDFADGVITSGFVTNLDLIARSGYSQANMAGTETGGKLRLANSNGLGNHNISWCYGTDIDVTIVTKHATRFTTIPANGFAGMVVGHPGAPAGAAILFNRDASGNYFGLVTGGVYGTLAGNETVHLRATYPRERWLYVAGSPNKIYFQVADLTNTPPLESDWITIQTANWPAAITATACKVGLWASWDSAPAAGQFAEASGYNLDY
jgi:hypothetical protein